MKQVIFFDGVCLLCNGFVDFLLERDRAAVFQFASLQGEKAKELLPSQLREELGSVVLLSKGNVYVQSDAILMILSQLEGCWKLVWLGWAVPRGLRDLVYRFVAARRYSWFGKSDSCRMPTPAERDRFFS